MLRNHVAADLSCGNPCSKHSRVGEDEERGRQLRADYRCDCAGDQWDESEPRGAVTGFAGNWQEFFRDEIDKGEKPDRPLVQFCPYRVLRDPFVNEIAEAWKWWSKGQLHLIRPHPAKVLADALPIYDAELKASEDWELDRMREDSEREAKRKAEESGR